MSLAIPGWLILINRPLTLAHQISHNLTNGKESEILVLNYIRRNRLVKRNNTSTTKSSFSLKASPSVIIQ